MMLHGASFAVGFIFGFLVAGLPLGYLLLRMFRLR